MLEGNHNGFVWRARSTYKNAATYRTPVERVYNSAFNEFNNEGFIGLNKKWGYSHLHVSRWNANIGLVEGERDSATGKFVEAAGNIVSDDDLKSRKLFLPNQNIRHTKLSSVNSFFMGSSSLKLNLGYQHNDRREFEDDENNPALFFHLVTGTYDVKYYLPEYKNMQTVFGVQGMNQQNRNRGEEYLIPEYELNDGGVFISAKKSTEKFTLNAGVRYDARNIKSKQQLVEGEELFQPFTSTFQAVTGSVGSTYKISKVFM